MAERKQKNDPGKYAADIWGTELTQTRQSTQTRRGKNGTIVIGGKSFTQDALFQGEEIRIPFPNAPVNKIPDRLGMTAEKGTLFSTPEQESQSTQTELFTSAQDAEDHTRISLPVDPQVGKLPDDLKPFVTYIPLHLLSQEQRKQGIMPYVTTTFFIYRSERNGYVPGIMLADEEGKERKPLSYGVTKRPGDIEAAYEQIRRVIDKQGLRTDATTVSEGENPLLAILREDEIYVDPFEVTIDEAEENGYPLLRRDVKSFRWWLEFGYDVRDDPKLYEALKEQKWKWGGYRKQWFHPNPYAKVPEGLYYGNAGPCFYSEERAERLEARQVRASVRATEHHERSDRMASVIPFGQPMMPDHYSYKSDLSYRKKIWRQMDQFVEYYKKAEWLGDRAESSRRHQAWKESVFAMKNRLDRLEADVRSMRRRYQEDLRDGESRDLDHWRRCMTILATEIVPLRQAIDAAGGLPIEQAGESLKPGDYIKIAGRPQYVVRVNKTTITCAHPTLTLHSGKPWETKYKKTDFQELLATAEEVKERKQKGEGEKKEAQ